MTHANWPTVDAINQRIALSAKVNGLVTSKLSGRGNLFLKYGKKYGINPAVAVAIAQRECQLAADGSQLPRWNNFGGITDPLGHRGTCGSDFFLDRQWAKFCTIEDGVEGIFKVLDGKLYRGTDGTFAAIMHLYSPQFENDWKNMWDIFTVVGKQLGVSLDMTTKIYGKPSLRRRLRNALRPN